MAQDEGTTSFSPKAAGPPPEVDHHLAIDLDGEQGAEVFARRELGREQFA